MRLASSEKEDSYLLLNSKSESQIMNIYYFCILSVNFVSFNAEPIGRAEILKQKYLAEDDLGSNLYSKLDEAAQKGLDLAEEAKKFIDGAERTQVGYTCHN